MAPILGRWNGSATLPRRPRPARRLFGCRLAAREKLAGPVAPARGAEKVGQGVFLVSSLCQTVVTSAKLTPTRKRVWPYSVAECGVSWPRLEERRYFDPVLAWPCLLAGATILVIPACPRKRGDGTRQK